MSLPLVFDIAIGLIFIYLILSLLASELQELITTLLQWRAIHLKQSIENLLAGEEGASQEVNKVKTIVDDLYSNPLIQNINQQSKKGIEAALGQMVWQVLRLFQKKENPVFGKDNQKQEKRSAPSYIPAETFASTLLERLNIPELTHKISATTLIKFKEEEIKLEIKERIIAPLQVSQDTKNKLENELNKFTAKLDRITDNFKLKRTTLVNSLKWMENGTKGYIESSLIHFNEYQEDGKNQFEQEINSLKEELFIDLDALEKRLKGGLAQVVYELETGGKFYTELKSGMGDNSSELYKAYEELETDIKALMDRLPESVRGSISALGRRVQFRAKKTDQELQELQKEIEFWFDRSMDRASGVYKRNAKGVAFLIGLFLATATNADTFHIINRLSKDTPLRTAITENAGRAVTNCQTNQLDCIRTEINQSLGSLPIGRTPDNLLEQELESKNWPVPYLKRILGWIVSGIAIAMGAPFWFELLSKVMNVRNTGPKPVSSTEKQNSAKEG